MPEILNEAAVDLSAVDAVTTSFKTGMGELVGKVTGFIGDAAPYLIGVVAAGIVVAVGLKLLKKFKSN